VKHSDAPHLLRTEDAVLRAQATGHELDDALRHVVAYQREHIPALARFWNQRGFDRPPERPEDIPPVPTDVFQHVRLVSDEAEPTRVFRTSGTTGARRGEAWRISTRAYDAGARAQFKRLVLPDRERIGIHALTFDPIAVPDSSLAHMVGDLAEAFAPAAPTYHLTPTRFDAHATVRALQSLTEPTLVLGTAFAFVHLMDALRERIAMPPGSRIVETGGFKGRSRDVERAVLYDWFTTHLGVPATHCLSEYSMTELSSQLYTDTLERHLAGQTPLTLQDARLIAPPWCHVILRDPQTLAPLDRGQTGLVSFVDLANVDTPCAVLTSDLGTLDDRGLILHGRASDADARGCSLAVEEVLELQHRHHASNGATDPADA
jgi:hypothetical protein